jgi:prepilin-type N-terminal cleavage/methylation domain-containing protein
MRTKESKRIFMKWHSLLQKARKQAAFTMIELLIVISILGILAVAVLAAIDPIEQINRGRDTGTRSDAEQLLSAIDRYYAMKGYYPWQAGATDPVSSIDFQAIDDELKGTATCPILARLSETANVSGCDTDSGSQELKQAYVQKVSDPNYNSLYVYNAGTVGSSTYVCFKPKSKSFIQEAIDRFIDTTNNNTAIDPPADYPTEALANGEACGISQVTDGTRNNNCVCLP